MALCGCGYLYKWFSGAIVAGLCCGCGGPGPLRKAHVSAEAYSAQESAQSVVGRALRASSPERTISLCTRAISLDSMCAPAYIVRGAAWARINVAVDAAKDFGRAYAIDSAYARSWFDLLRISLPSAGDGAARHGFPAIISGTSAVRINIAEPQAPERIHPPVSGRDIAADSAEGLVSMGEKLAVLFIERGIASGHGNGQSPEISAAAGPGACPKAGTHAAFDGSLELSIDQSSAGKNLSANHDDRGKGTAAPARQEMRNAENAAPAPIPTRTAQLEGHAQTVPQGGTHAGPALSSESRPASGTAQTPSPSEPPPDTCARAPSGTTAYHLCTAQRLYRAAEYNAAIDELTRAIKLDRKLTEAYLLRSKAFGALSRFDLAYKDFKKAKKLSPENPLVHFTGAWIYHCMDKKVNEIECLRKALSCGYDKPETVRFRLEMLGVK
jgi:tetratricopeptide (TPR) repeat protein